MKLIISEEKLLELLPHGAGIDCKWNIHTCHNGNIIAKNFFHAMNENGMYDGYMGFTVRIYREKNDQFNLLKGPCEGKTQVVCRKGDISFSLSCCENRRSFYGLKEYLYDTLHYSLETILTKRIEII